MRQRHFHPEIKMTKTGRFFHVIFILTNKQGDRYHSGVNQSKTITKPTMLIQLKMTQNEEKHVKKWIAGPVSLIQWKNVDKACLNIGYVFLVGCT